MTGVSASRQDPRATRPIGAERSTSKMDAGRKSSESKHRHRSSTVERRDKYLSVERAPDEHHLYLRTVQRAAVDRSLGAVDTPLSRTPGSAYHDKAALACRQLALFPRFRIDSGRSVQETAESAAVWTPMRRSRSASCGWVVQPLRVRGVAKCSQSTSPPQEKPIWAGVAWWRFPGSSGGKICVSFGADFTS